MTMSNVELDELYGKINIRMLKAGNGDSFFVTWKDIKGEHAILIDTGTSQTAIEIRSILNDHPIPIDAMIVTHIDDDHVGGAIELLKTVPEIIAEKVSKIVINSPETISIVDSCDAGVSHGITFLDLIKKSKIEHLLNSATSDKNDHIIIGEANICILSPSTTSVATVKMIREWKRELQEIKNSDLDAKSSKSELFKSSNIVEYSRQDFTKKLYPKTDFVNGSSIAFVFKLFNKSVLFLGDSHPKPVCEELLKKEIALNFDCIKLSHHGSLHNISQDIVSTLKSKKFIVSTNGKYHSHPDPVTLAKLFIENEDPEKKEKIYFYFNYPCTEMCHLTCFCQDAQNYSDIKLIHPINGKIDI